MFQLEVKIKMFFLSKFIDARLRNPDLMQPDFPNEFIALSFFWLLNL